MMCWQYEHAEYSRNGCSRLQDPLASSGSSTSFLDCVWDKWDVEDVTDPEAEPWEHALKLKLLGADSLGTMSQAVGAEQMGKPGGLGFSVWDYFGGWLSQIPETKQFIGCPLTCVAAEADTHMLYEPSQNKKFAWHTRCEVQLSSLEFLKEIISWKCFAFSRSHSFKLWKILFLCKRSNETQYNTLIRDQEIKEDQISTCKQ